ncbi:MAG: hypothetical protein K8L99_06720 [Anaerolineae bacterium]|nr:hypothetical protein [Anaerolineae bacterium]
MMKKITGVLICFFILAGCSLNFGPTGDTISDPSSASTLLPNVAGYTRTNARSVTDALTTVGVGASAITGNLLTSAAIAQIDRMLQCYENVGAVAASVYTQSDISTVLQGEIPRLGAVGVINQDRLVNNFLNCAVGGAGDAFSAQSAEVEPCGGSGTTVVNGENISYVYAATAPELCQAFDQYFNSFKR